MTHLTEIKDLQAKARRAGRIVNLFIDGDVITGVFYRNPRATALRLKVGMILPVLSVAEKERMPPAWSQSRYVNHKLSNIAVKEALAPQMSHASQRVTAMQRWSPQFSRSGERLIQMKFPPRSTPLGRCSAWWYPLILSGKSAQSLLCGGKINPCLVKFRQSFVEISPTPTPNSDTAV